MTGKNNDAFKVEKWRSELASSGKYKKLLTTYSGRFPRIPNLNTPKMWDILNDRDYTDKKQYMNYHKLTLISKEIKNKNIKVLNAACGAGDLEHFVFDKQNKHKLNWYGIDISQKSIKSCKSKFKNARFDTGNVKKMKFKDKSFDIIAALEILEHISPRDTFGVLNEFGRILKNKGMIIVSIPLNEGLEEMIQKGNNPNAHVRIYTPELIKAELTIAGFTVKKEEYLFAFSNYYRIKSLIAKYILKNIRKPNSMIIFARKL